MNKPNIVFFMLDQLSTKWLEAADSGACPTPSIHRLRRMGVTFTSAITSNPLCCPARSTIATGLTTRGHGVLDNGYYLDEGLPTFMQALQEGGWRTAALGKVHFHPQFAGLCPDYRRYGFDVTHITEDPRAGEWLDWVEKDHPEHFEAVLATHLALEIPDFESYGPHQLNLRRRIERVRAEFQWADARFPQNTAEAYTLPFPEEVSQSNWITMHALNFLRETPMDRPLYAHVSYVEPHVPFCAPRETMQSVNPEKIPQLVPAEWAEDPHAPAYFKDREPVVPRDWRYRRQLYFADIVHLDRQLGRIMDALEQSDRSDNTYLILVADHGEMLGDHGCWEKAEKHYDTSVRVPLIIAGPGLMHGLVRDEMVQLEDICPTVLDMGGRSLPPVPQMWPYQEPGTHEAVQLPGRSLLPLCRGDTVSDWRHAAYCESYDNVSPTKPGQWARTIRTKEFRYTFYPGCPGGNDQMFDFRSDPDEQRNIVADPAYAEIRQELRDELIELIVLQDYPKTRRNLFALGVH